MTSALNIKAFLNTLSSRSRTLPIVILYVTEGCNLQCITCSYRNALPGELTIAEIQALAHTLKRHGLQHIVYSGGEPLLRRDFPEICRIMAGLNLKQTLLTNGLLLEKRWEEIKSYFHEIIVSVDGPDAGTHNAIRGVASFDQIVKGIQKVLSSTGRPSISIRSVVQKRNFRQILAMVAFAKSVNVDRVSFLAADVLSNSFGRDTRGQAAENSAIMLDQDDLVEFHVLLEQMFTMYSNEFSAGFISESPAKMLHIYQYFDALCNKTGFPRNYCNAPMVSLVITSTGIVQPCYFLPEVGTIKNQPVDTIMNNPALQTVRRDVKEYTLERCRTCVCTLHVTPGAALLNRF